MTIDEIREKYHCDKRQTGQLFVRGKGMGGDFRKTKITDPEESKIFKQEKRYKAQNAAGPDDVAKRNQELRKAKAEVLNSVRKFENTVKKATSGQLILSAFEFLKFVVIRAASTYDWKRDTGRVK